VILDVYDILGRKIGALADKRLPQGQNSVIFKADDLASGIYIYKLQAGGYSWSKKMVFLK